MNVKRYSVHNFVKRFAAILKSPTKKERVAEQEVWWLLEKLTGKDEATLLAQESLEISEQQKTVLDQWLRERVDHKKPLQYILGSVPFCNLEIMVEPPILIPRPETEEMTMWVIDALKKNGQPSFDLLDLCTGTGCIALACAAAFPQARVVGVDINPAAVSLAEKNRRALGLENVIFIQSDLYASLGEKKFDLMVSNPPYLSSTCYADVSDEIRLWEDKQALVAQHDGMEIYERIISGARGYLKRDSIEQQVVFEIGKDQDSIEALFSRARFKNIRVYNDMQGMRRWVAAKI